ncbi:MAG: DUF3000 domain-containing protein [Actinobacteria bacterium]|jgi:hypothetical protein|nr:DUF3000 domain-containing protein [Actinomycetota bacterium]
MREPTFDEIISEIRALKVRNEILFEEVPAPQKLAPFALAMTADVLEDAATGRFVLLHDPDGQDGWSGKFRCVTFVRAAIDNEMASDPLLCDIGWTWLMESLARNDCDFTAPSGTVTRVASASYGTLENIDDGSELEVRASWTPTTGRHLANNVMAWLELLELSAGLQPIPHGVTQLSRAKLANQN